MLESKDKDTHCLSIEHWISRQEDVEAQYESKFGKKISKKIICISFFMVLLGDLIASFDQYAMVHSWFYVQMATGIITQLTWLSMSFLFISAESNRERIIIGLSQAFGASVGSSLMLKYVKPFFEELFRLT
jgi:hypothetical protein